MGYTLSVDASQLRRLICHAPAHEGEAIVLEMRRTHAYWGARRIAFELARKAGRARTLGIGGLSLLGSRRGHRPHQPTVAPGDLEALGAGRAKELWQLASCMPRVSAA